MKWHLHLSETDKHFLVSLVYGTGIIIFWRGVWGIADEIPILQNVFVSFFVGLLILTLTGFIYREFDPLESRTRRLRKLLHNVSHEAKRGKKVVIEYYDAIAKERVRFGAASIHDVEDKFVILKRAGREIHLPFKRITRVVKGDEPIWKR